MLASDNSEHSGSNAIELLPKQTTRRSIIPGERYWLAFTFIQMTVASDIYKNLNYKNDSVRNLVANGERSF